MCRAAFCRSPPRLTECDDITLVCVYLRSHPARDDRASSLTTHVCWCFLVDVGAASDEGTVPGEGADSGADPGEHEQNGTGDDGGDEDGGDDDSGDDDDGFTPPVDPAAEDPNQFRWAVLLRVMQEDNQVALDQSDDEDGGLEGEDEVTPLFSELSIAQQNARHKHCLLTTLAHSPFYVIFQSTSKVIFYFCSMGYERTCASVQTLHS